MVKECRTIKRIKMYSKWYFKCIYSNTFKIAINEFYGNLGAYMTKALLAGFKSKKIKMYILF